MEILRRIDKGYRLIEQAKDKSERLMNVESIKRLKHELDLILKEENAIRVQVDQARTGLLIKEKQLSDVDRQLLSILEKLYESEHQNSKILQELKKQEVILKDKKINLEDEIMKEFYIIEKFSKELNLFKSKYNKVEKQYNSKKISQHEKVAYLEDKLKLTEKKIRKLRKSADPDLLRLYDKKRQTMKVVFTRAENGVCEICHMTLSTSLIEKVENCSEIIECDCCNRILYLEEIKDNDETL